MMTIIANIAIKISGYYLVSASSIFLFTGCAKIYSAIGNSVILTYPDPVFGLRFKDLFLITGCLEIFISVLCLFRKSPIERALFILWLCLCFVTYRTGMFLVGYNKPCRCLGDLTERLNISDVGADTAMKVILFYLIIGSCLILYANKERVIGYFGAR